MLNRSDSGEDAYSATFNLRYYAGDLLGSDFTLTLTDYVDTVIVTPDIQFTYPSMRELYAAVTSGDQGVCFSLVFEDAVIDRIAVVNESDGYNDSHLLVSYRDFPENTPWPLLINTQTGEIYYGSRCKESGGEDGNTVRYDGVTEDMLPDLFMKQDGGCENVTRVQGTWIIPFSVGEDTGMTVRSFEVDEELTYHEYTLRVTNVNMTDSSLYFDGEYSITPPPEGMMKYGSIYRDIDLVMEDGTVLEDVFYQGVSAEFGGNTCRWGGTFVRFIDTSKVVTVIALGETIPLTPSE